MRTHRGYVMLELLMMMLLLLLPQSCCYCFCTAFLQCDALQMYDEVYTAMH
jgi:hypothetical protein